MISKMNTALCGLMAVGTFAAAAVAGPTYTVNLTPLNNSGVSGSATFEVSDSGDMLMVAVAATGLVPSVMHPQHIHGFEDASMNSMLPPASAAGDDGILTVPEGAPFYGAIRLPLITGGTPIFPTSSADGTLSYTHIFSDAEAAASSSPAGGVPIGSISDLFPLENREFVIHGVSVDGQYMATLPAAAGELVLVDNGGGGPAVVPLPNAALAGLATLGLLGTVGYVRRRKATA